MLEKFLLAGAVLFTLTGIAPPGNPPPQETPAVEQAVSTPKIDPKPQDLTYQQQSGIFLYGANAIANQCAAQPSNLWCQPYNLKQATLSGFDIVTISLQTKRNFKYLADTVDSWRVHSSEVLMKQEWRGDCDDLTSTTLDMMVRAGQPLDKIWFVLADVEHKSVLDHLIGMVQDKDGHYWIIGDTSAQNAYPVSELKYRIVGVASGADLQWKDPHAVGAFPAESLQSNPIAPAPIIVNLPPFELMKTR